MLLVCVGFYATVPLQPIPVRFPTTTLSYYIYVNLCPFGPPSNLIVPGVYNVQHLYTLAYDICRTFLCLLDDSEMSITYISCIYDHIPHDSHIHGITTLQSVDIAKYNMTRQRHTTRARGQAYAQQRQVILKMCLLTSVAIICYIILLVNFLN
jgi:hypothetical protein